MKRYEIWKENLSKLNAYAEQNKKLPTTSSADPETRKLGIWISYQRTLKRQGVLEEEKASNLESIDTWTWSAQSSTWESNLEKMKLYYKKTRNLRPDQRSADPESRRLSTWIRSQVKQHLDGNIKEERRLLLSNLDKFFK